jgi:hypothetical protein
VRIRGATAILTELIGNYIGVNVDSSHVVPNGQEGVVVLSADNTIGGTVQGSSNVISGNARGIFVSGAAATSNLILGNFIGTDFAGIQDFGNSQEGIRIDGAPGNTVGGTVSSTVALGGTNVGSRNLISGNNVGLLLIGTATTNTLVEGNFIGTDTNGTADLGNSQEGIRIDGSPANTIGGTASGAGNLISANHWGLTITGAASANNMVQGNFIGTDVSGTLPLSNELDGVLFLASASNSTIGGIQAKNGNTIGYNVRDGVRVESATSMNDAILSNRIFRNGALDVDLVPPAVFPPGPNNLQAAPVLTKAASGFSNAFITGSLTSTPNTTFTIQFFAQVSATPAQDGLLLGTVTEVTNAAGIASFTASVPMSLMAGEAVRALATDPNGNTSEFSNTVAEVVGAVQFAVAGVIVDEAAGTASIAVVRVGGSGGFFQVNYATQDGTAFAGISYLASSGTLTFGLDQTSQTISIPIVNSTISGPNIAFSVLLSNPIGQVTLGTPSVATVTIIQDGHPVVGGRNLVVTTTSDFHVAGHLSLREAITMANADPGPDTISFSFPDLNTPGVVNYDPMFQRWIIQPTSPLPAITDQVFIDGYTQRVIGSTAATPESQAIAMVGSPTGGTFTLTFMGQQTTLLPFDATSAMVQSALEALPAIGKGNITAIGGPLAAPPGSGQIPGNIVVTFQKLLTNTALPLITANSSGLTGGVNPTVQTTITIPGVPASILSAPNTLTVGSDAHVRVVLDGSQSNGATGLTIMAGASRVRGLAIDGFAVGIQIVGPTAVGDLIQGDFIGKYVGYLNPGLTGPPSQLLGIGNSQAGILINAPTNNTIGGPVPEEHNTIDGNGGPGIHILPGAEGNQVEGNLIGIAQQDAQFYYIAGNTQDGVLVESSSNAIGGAIAGDTNVISGNGVEGIHITGSAATSNRILGNYIGTDPGGTLLFGQGTPGNAQDGILIENAPNTIIGGTTQTTRNVISGNFGAGARITGSTATGTALTGNFIGVNLDSSRMVPNGQEGVVILTAGNTIGGTASGSSNVISGNLRGVLISGAGATNNLVEGNFIGTDIAGIQDFGNAQEGIRIENAPGNTIGGTAAPASSGSSSVGSRNLISGNNVGVLVLGAAASGNVVLGNFIGTDTKGMSDLGNSQEGVRVDGAPSNTIGGTAAGAANLISANHWGITITGASATNTLVEGNLIGTDVTGNSGLGNELDGVLFLNQAAHNFIGGLGTGQGNTIGFNVRDGVRVESPQSVSDAILTNRIYRNGGLDIDLVPTAIPPGPNHLQAGPQLTAVASTSTGALVSGVLTSAPNTSYIIQFFDPNASSTTEDGFFLGMTTVVTDANGNASFTAIIPTPLTPGEAVRATATDPNGNTSEFSNSISEVLGNVQFASASTIVSEGAGTVTLTVVRAGGSGGFFRVNYATQNGTAIAGTNYQPVSGTLTFAPGQNSETIVVPIVEDFIPNPDVAFSVVLSNPVGAVNLGTPSSEVVTIKDADQPGEISFSSPTYTVNEADGQATITVVRDSAGGLVTVHFATADGTAIAGVDYTAVSGTLTFQPRQTVQTFTVPVVDDTIIDGDKTLSLVLNSPTGGASLGLPSVATVVIKDDLRDRIPPKVLGVQLVESRAGVTGAVITFSKRLNPTTAQNLLNYGYSIRTAGRDRIFGTGDDRLVGITSAVYNDATRSVALSFSRIIHPTLPFQLAIDAATNVPSAGVGVSDLPGNLLDGGGGGIFQAILSERTGSITAGRAHRSQPSGKRIVGARAKPRHTAHAKGLAPHAVDVVLAAHLRLVSRRRNG